MRKSSKQKRKKSRSRSKHDDYDNGEEIKSENYSFNKKDKKKKSPKSKSPKSKSKNVSSDSGGDSGNDKKSKKKGKTSKSKNVSDDSGGESIYSEAISRGKSGLSSKSSKKGSKKGSEKASESVLYSYAIVPPDQREEATPISIATGPNSEKPSKKSSKKSVKSSKDSDKDSKKSEKGSKKGEKGSKKSAKSKEKDDEEDCGCPKEEEDCGCPQEEEDCGCEEKQKAGSGAMYVRVVENLGGSRCICEVVCGDGTPVNNKCGESRGSQNKCGGASDKSFYLRKSDCSPMSKCPSQGSPATLYCCSTDPCCQPVEFEDLFGLDPSSFCIVILVLLGGAAIYSLC